MKLTHDDITRMSKPELEDACREIEQELVHIKEQLDDAKARRSVDGEYAERWWLVKAKSAIRHKGRTHQMLLQELGARNRKEKQARASSSERLFRNVAYEILPITYYRQIVDEVIRREQTNTPVEDT